MNEKSALRLLLKRRLQELSQERRKRASGDAHVFLSQLSSPSILSFSSKEEELDLSLFNQKLAEEGRLLLPKIEGERLEIYKVHDLSIQTALHSFGFLEPLSEVCERVPINLIDLVLVPGLGFDFKLHRIGYGKGFYDRFLEGVEVPRLGIGFTEQYVESALPSSHDIPLTALHLF